MADNVILSAGTADGVTLATDDVGGVHYQIVKVSFGALDTATAVSGANPLPVVQTGALPAGTNAIGKLAANSGVDIGDVDVTSVPADPFGANADAASATGSISAKLRFIAATGIPITGNVTVVNAGTFATQAAQSGTWTVQPGNTANTTAWLVTGTGGTFPVTDSGGSLTVDGTVSITANSSVNVAQLAGTTTDTNSGNKSAGTLRVVLATDQPQLTNKLLVTPDANSAVNCAQIAGTTTATGNGTASAGCQRVTIASDNTAFSVNATSKPATTGGYTTATGSIAATKTDIKGSAGQVYGWYFYNPNASVAYVQFFNAAAASVTLGTTAPVYSLGIPATSGANVFNDHGIPHSTAICIAVTTTRSGSTGPGSTVDYNIWYS